MLCPLDLEAPLSPGLHKTHPLELHWRKTPPHYRGNIEKAYFRMYPGYVDDVLCFQCGAIPCPYKHDDTDKKQRLVDLDFIKELAKDTRETREENKKMEKCIQDLHEKAAILFEEKQGLKIQVEYYERMENEWNRAKSLLEAEIRRLQLLNEQNQDFINEYKKDQLRLKFLQQKLEDAELENQRLKEENERCLKRLYSQTEEIDKLTKTNDIITKELDKNTSKVKRLVIQLEESKEQLTKAKEQLKLKDETIARMEKNIAELVDEIREKTNFFQQKEKEFDILVTELKTLILNLKMSNKESNDRINELLLTIERLREEIKMLKKKLASDTRFKQFVEIKRECNVLKDISGNMAQKLKDIEDTKPLPVVKKSGKVFKKSKAYGPGSRPSETIIKRPKSANIRSCVEDISNGSGELANLRDFEDESRPVSSMMLNRPKSARSQFRSPSVMDCYTDAALYVLNEPVVKNRPRSAMCRSSPTPEASKYLMFHETKKSMPILEINSPQSQIEINPESKKPEIQDINEGTFIDITVANTDNPIDRNSNNVQEGIRHTNSPVSDSIGSDFDHFTFDTL